ncbi:hypothetical protein F3J02_03625 [Acinetobacter sp. Tr-809]|nr:hypothetical protein [Acinetobacter sp. Tr-809]
MISMLLSACILLLLPGCTAHTINNNIHVGICVKALIRGLYFLKLDIKISFIYSLYILKT